MTEMKPLISVIIPTYNRSKELRETLEGLSQQSLPFDRYEVILVDDGSREDLSEVCGAQRWPYPLRFLQQAHRGPAAARNLGASHALGDVLLFLDSDMIATPTLLEQHLQSHQQPSRLVVGLRSRYPGMKPDRLDRFDYRPDGSDPRLDRLPLTFQEAFTCNLSISAADWGKLNGFDERYPTQSFEDIEFAYQCTCMGMEIFLNQNAIAYHDHPVTDKDRWKRAVSYTQTVPLLFASHPELRGTIKHLRDKEPISWKSDPPGLIAPKILRLLMALPPVLLAMKWLLNRLEGMKGSEKLVEFFYWKVLGSYHFLGLRKGIQLYGWKMPADRI